MILLLVGIHCILGKPVTDNNQHGYELTVIPENSNLEPFVVPVDEKTGSLGEVVKKMKRIALYRAAAEKRNFGPGRIQGYLASMRNKNGPNVNAWNKEFRNMFGG